MNPFVSVVVQKKIPRCESSHCVLKLYCENSVFVISTRIKDIKVTQYDAVQSKSQFGGFKLPFQGEKNYFDCF